MYVIIIAKRYPQGRDLFHDPYGRFYFLAQSLADLGHRVQLLLLDHRPHKTITRQEHNLTLISDSLWNWHTLLWRLREHRSHAQPDWLIGCSDPWICWLAMWYARVSQRRLMLDAYDNFIAYYPACPWLRSIWSQALRRAELVTAAGPQLAQLMQTIAGIQKIHLLPMTADPAFYPRDRENCRAQLGLPARIPLLGHLGSLDHHRDLELLYHSYFKLQQRVPELRLVLSGRYRPRSIPASALWLGYRPHSDMPLVVNSLTVATIINKASAFGHYSYPAKLYEAMSCQVPVVATAAAGVAWILRAHPACLAPIGCTDTFTEKCLMMLNYQRYDYGLIPDWRQLGSELEQLLLHQ
jgi:glycosyltransferase involved in cell wall biosynthesis